MTYLLDTDTFTLAHRATHGVRGRIGVARRSHEVAVPISTRIEVLRGRFEAVLKAVDAADLLRLHDRLLASEAFLAEFRVVPFDATAGGHFDRLRANKRLKKIDRGDILNACIALANDATLVTRNTKDFAAVPGLKLENWAD